MLRCDIIEDEEAAMSRFYGGLRHEIQDIVDYKEYDSVPRLFQLACLAEKELQGRQQRPRNNFGSTSTPRSTPGQFKTVPPSATRSAAPSTSRARSAAPPTPSHAPEVSKSTSVQAPAKSSTSVACDGVGGAAERALLVEGAADSVAEGGNVLTCTGVDLGVDVLPKLFLGLCCRPCNSFSAKHAR